MLVSMSPYSSHTGLNICTALRVYYIHTYIILHTTYIHTTMRATGRAIHVIPYSTQDTTSP